MARVNHRLFRFFQAYAPVSCSNRSRRLRHPLFVALLTVIGALAAALTTTAWADVSYSYDSAGWITCVDNGAGAQRGYCWDPVGNLYAITNPCNACPPPPAGAAALSSGTPSAADAISTDPSAPTSDSTTTDPAATPDATPGTSTDSTAAPSDPGGAVQ